MRIDCRGKPIPQEKTEHIKFAERLNHAMIVRDCTNVKLAKTIYVSPSTISAYRTGYRKPSLEQLRDISLALHVSTDYLLGLQDHIYPY